MAHYSVLIQWSEEDNASIATVPKLPGLSAFGSTPEEAAKELAIAQEAYIEVLQEDREEIPEPDVLKPFSGQTRLRLPKSLHALLSYEAQREGVSLNTYIVQLLSERNALRQFRKAMASLENQIYVFMLQSYPSTEKQVQPKSVARIINIPLQVYENENSQ